jgi:hypothetical protein
VFSRALSVNEDGCKHVEIFHFKTQTISSALPTQLLANTNLLSSLASLTRLHPSSHHVWMQPLHHEPQVEGFTALQCASRRWADQNIPNSKSAPGSLAWGKQAVMGASIHIKLYSWLKLQAGTRHQFYMVIDYSHRTQVKKILTYACA